MRYKDPNLGPRTIPNLEKPEDGKVTITPEATFSVNLQSKKITMKENGRTVDIGSQMVYVIHTDS